jgi:hypothetical protein
VPDQRIRPHASLGGIRVDGGQGIVAVAGVGHKGLGRAGAGNNLVVIAVPISVPIVIGPVIARHVLIDSSVAIVIKLVTDLRRIV